MNLSVETREVQGGAKGVQVERAVFWIVRGTISSDFRDGTEGTLPCLLSCMCVGGAGGFTSVPEIRNRGCIHYNRKGQGALGKILRNHEISSDITSPCCASFCVSL
jgi:hypothetical protein